MVGKCLRIALVGLFGAPPLRGARHALGEPPRPLPALAGRKKAPLHRGQALPLPILRPAGVTTGAYGQVMYS